MEFLTRTRMLIGDDAINRLQKSSVAVFGLGGVGGYAVEALARSGIGSLTLIDHDTVAQSNINRQLYALNSTLGQPKVDVARQRISDINTDCRVNVYKEFYDSTSKIDLSEFSFVVDAIDTVTSKLLLIKSCAAVGTPIISCMGTGNKLDPSRLKIADIYSTDVCPLARVMRKELKQLGIKNLDVVYSCEQPIKSESATTERKQTPSSIAFVPAAAGILLASFVVNTLLRSNTHE